MTAAELQNLLHNINEQEKSPPILYHVTTIDSAKKIIQENILKGGLKRQGTIVSFTSNSRYWLTKGNARFIINGTSLNEVYPLYSYENVNFLKQATIKSEYEFRAKGPIQNFLSYCLGLELHNISKWSIDDSRNPLFHLFKFFASIAFPPIRIINLDGSQYVKVGKHKDMPKYFTSSDYYWRKKIEGR